VKILNKYEERSATPALGKAISSVNMPSDSSAKASIYALNRRSSPLGCRSCQFFPPRQAFGLFPKAGQGLLQGNNVAQEIGENAVLA
jgi:hypothetical protein